MGKFCTNCGQESSGGNFCSSCGTAINSNSNEEKIVAIQNPFIINLNGKSINMAAVVAKYEKNKISAIKYVRETAESGLQEAKDAVDAVYEKLSISDAKAIMAQYPNEDQNQSQKAPSCPKCHSTSLSANKKGFGFGKSIVGGLLAGPIGLLVGSIGASKVQVTCLNCGNQFQVGK